MEGYGDAAEEQKPTVTESPTSSTAVPPLQQTPPLSDDFLLESSATVIATPQNEKMVKGKGEESEKATESRYTDNIADGEKVMTGAQLQNFIIHTMARPFNGEFINLTELYAGGSTLAVALVLEGYGLSRLRSVEINDKQREIGLHNLSALRRLFPERVPQAVVDQMHTGPQDVRAITADELGGDDMVGAGFPCQDMTRANRKRMGFRGGRSGQYYQLETLLKRLVKLTPSVSILLENVDFSDTFPEDFKRVNMAWGRGVLRDAADVSWEHRLRIWWGHNIKVKRAKAKIGLDVKDVLEPENEPRIARYTDKPPFSVYNIQDEPQQKFVTQLTRDDTYNVRSGDAMVKRRESKQLMRPWTVELSRSAGWWDCFVASAPVEASDKVFCLGNSQDLNEVRDILRDWKPGNNTFVPRGVMATTTRSEPTKGSVSKDMETKCTEGSDSEVVTTKGCENPGTLQVAATFADAVGLPEEGELVEPADSACYGLECSNPFSVLADLEEEEPDYVKNTPDCLKGHAGEMLYRVAAEIRKRFPKKGFSKRQPTHPQDCVTAADWKYLLAYKLPIIMHIPVPKIMSAKCKAEWNCISLKRLRFQGSKEHYVVVRDVSNQRRLLVLHVPDKHLNEREQQRHAEQQATFHDNAEGVMEKGIRIKFNNWKQLDLSEVQLDRLKRGQELLMQYTPPQSRKKNYESSWEYEGMTRAELDRYLDKGWMEGPLHYQPWLVMPLGAVYKADTKKYRLVLDATASGLNAAMVDLWCRYDMLDDALPHLSPHDWLSKLDFADAFFHWAYKQADCDLLGVRCPESGKFYRFRFTFFGSKQAPAVQQGWTHTLKRLVNTHGLKYCEKGSPEADYTRFSMVGGFVDDCVQRHCRTLSKEQADRQFESVVRFLAEDLGVEVKRKKDVYPCTCVDYTGIMIDTEKQIAFLADDRRNKYRDAVAEFLSSHKAGDKVNRREIASIIGRLQWAAQIVRGGQLKLTRCYWCRDLFCDVSLAATGSTKEKWGKHVEVTLTEEACEDLAWWVDVLAQRSATEIYLSRHPTTSGFWKGLVREDDAILDRTSETEEGIIVFTTDASGYGGGGWWKHERLHKAYTVDEGPQFRSSNWREMDMVKSSLDHWGERWRGRRVLVRCDNSVTVSSIQKRRVKVKSLHTLFTGLMATCAKYDIRLAARHIPGVANGLADRISRWRPERDHSDWLLDPGLVAQCAAITGAFDVDACADPLGHNAQVERFWSKLDSCLEHSWAGLHVWCNPDFDMISEVLDHFRRCYSDAPQTTSAVFCVPVWFSQSYWRKLKGFRVLGCYPAGSDIFSAPEYWGSTGESYPSTRVNRGPTKWDTVLVYCPRALTCRNTSSRGGAAVSAGLPGAATDVDVQRLPVLSGDRLVDDVILREMSTVVV